MSQKYVKTFSERVALIGIVGVPANYGGFETLAENLLGGEIDFVIYCSGRSYSTRRARYKGHELVYIPLAANGFSSILFDIISIMHAIMKGRRKFLILGVSGALIFPIAKLLVPKLNIIVNIDGLEWRRQKWSFITRRLLKLFENIAVRFADKIICDNAAIQRYVFEEYSVSSQLIAYGGDHAITSAYQEHPNGDYSLAICRVEPENNVHVILQAYSRSGNKLKFVGNWTASQYGLTLLREYAGIANIELLDPVYDLNELFRLRSECICYVHGHSAGGTNPSLVEVMHFGRPLICFDCDYNRATLQDEGIYFRDVVSLTSILKAEEWKLQQPLIFREIARRRYTWDRVRKQYYDCIRS
jgi:glycosyltransferase involved in cell wall biosynthesis